jgi:hypothetical protein
MGIDDGMKKVGDAAELTKDSVSKLTESVVDGGRQFDIMLSAARNLSNGIVNLGTSLASINSGIPGINELGDALGFSAKLIGDLAGGATGLGKALYEGMGALDAFSSGHRKLQANMYDSSTQFGKTFEDATIYANNLLSISSMVGNAEFGWLQPDNLVKTANALTSNRINIDTFTDSIITSAGSFDLLTAATLQAGSSGLETSEYFRTLSQSILKQGLSAQDAMEQLSGFKDVSAETGLSIKTISDTLSSLGNSFSKIGLSADFGKPLLKGFASTISEMGLGMDNAAELAGTLSKSLASLGTDYSTMYVMAQRGNLSEMLGGGALGAGIQFQAQLLEAEGDPEAQSKIGVDMANALRDTIASFSGGDITTVQEAAANPALESQFYTQQKILEQMYNLDDQTAVRTLDLLDRMGEATLAGDDDLAASLGEDLQDVITKNDETKDLQEKANAYLAGLLSESMASNEALFFLGRETLGKAGLDSMTDASKAAFDALQGAMSGHRANAEAQINSVRSGERDLKSEVESIYVNAFGRNTTDGTVGPLDDEDDNSLIGNISKLVESNSKVVELMIQFFSGQGSAKATSVTVAPGALGAKPS